MRGALVGRRPRTRSPSMTRSLCLWLSAIAGWALLWLSTVPFTGSVTDESYRVGVLVAALVLTLLLVFAVAAIARRHPVVAADATVVLAATLVAGLSTFALHGTRWGMGGLHADSSFRTEMATRFATQSGLPDYAYRGLPAYYPPGLAWLEGRLAVLFGVAGWQTLKPLELALAIAVPLLAYSLWRRLLPALTAAVVVAATSLATVNLQKPDEWLVLCCVVPWWLEAVRGIRLPQIQPWPVWRHGLVLGLLLLTHTYFFQPLAVTTLVTLGVDLVRGNPNRLPLPRAAGIAAVGLLVASPYWIPMAWERLSGLPSDHLQMRYTYPWANLPRPPLPIDLVGGLGAVGLAWLWWSLRRGRGGPAETVAGGLLLVLIGAYLTMLLGELTVLFGFGLLSFKSAELVDFVYVCTGALGLVELTVRSWDVSRVRPASRLAPVAVGTTVATLAALPLMWRFVDHSVVGQHPPMAHNTRYPDGTWPAGGRDAEPTGQPTHVMPGDPSVSQVLAAWEEVSGGRPVADSVLVTSRVDLLATTPVHPFLIWKSIYSHPYGRFEQRLQVLRQMAACPDASCAARVARTNPYERVDGLVLERRVGRLLLPLNVDNFPNKTRPSTVAFQAATFEGPEFDRRDVGRLSVVALR